MSDFEFDSDVVATHLAWARVSALAEEARSAESVGQTAWLGALALVRDLEPPTPAPRAGGSDGSSGSGIPMLDGTSSGIRQILDDGTPLLGRLAGGWTVGQATGAGGGLGLAYCVAMSRRRKTMLEPGDALDRGAQGAERGRDGARRLVEVLHGR